MVHSVSPSEILVVFLFGAASLANCESTVARHVSATGLNLSGTVLVTPPGPGASTQDLDRDSRPKAGDVIETTQDGEAVFALLPGALIQIEPQSKLLIEEIKLGKNGFASAEAMQRSVRIRLLHGVLNAVVQWESEPPAWTVSMMNGRLITGSGGVFRIEARDGHVRVISVRGDCTFVPNDGRAPIRLESGYTQDWPAPRFAPFPAELDRQTLVAFERARDGERKLLELQGRLRSTPYPWR